MAPPAARPVLLVDDDIDCRAMLTTFLQLRGLGVLTAANGKEAYDLARRHQPGVILLDLMMPVMSGEEFRYAQLSTIDISHIPIVVVSAHHRAEAIAHTMRAVGCLSKPVDFDSLADMLTRAMGHGAAD